MFIRWQSRERQKPEFGPDGIPDVGWTVVLAESCRVDGKPRQRHIAYLASITESAIKIDPQRCYFWDRVTRALNRLGNQVSDDDRAKIEEAIALKVPRPSLSEYKDIARDSARKLGLEFLTDAQQAVLQDEADESQHFEGVLGGISASNSDASIESLHCSFCGKSHDAVFALVTSGEAHICDECIETAAALVNARKANEAELQASRSVVRPITRAGHPASPTGLSN